MLDRPSSLRSIARMVLVAVVLAAAMPGAHAAGRDAAAASAPRDTDFCASARPTDARDAELLAGPGKDNNVSAHCRDCLACTGASTIPPTRSALPPPAVGEGLPALAAVPPATTAIDVAAATPRGPPGVA